jgi:glycosyltransferase involved in cell wall biosynthesis
LGFVNKIDVRVFSTPKVKRDMEALYKKNNLPQSYFDKLFFVDNKVEIPVLAKPNNTTLQVLYVGRGAAQKRVHLLVQIVEYCYQKNIAVHFTFVGDVENYFTETNKKYCTLLGEIKDKKQLETIYNNSDALILTSAYEGLPLVVMDMMARGRVVISTAVDGIPDYIKHLQTGLLIENRSEQEIVADAVMLIEFLIANPTEKSSIENNAYQFAKSHFSNEVFDGFYRKVLEG